MDDIIEEINLLFANLDALKRQKKYDQAILLCNKICDLIKQKLGEKSFEFANALNTLALLYEDIGTYDKAESFFLQALKITRDLDAKHPDNAMILSNLSTVYMSTGDYNKAISICKEVLEIRRKILGENHPKVGGTLQNLGLSYLEIGEYTKAEEMLKQALEIIGQTSKEDAEFARVLNNLGQVYEAIKNFSKAEELYKQALKIWGQTVGEDDPEFANTLYNLSQTYLRTGDYDKAKPLLEKSTNIRCNVLGADHPKVAANLILLGYLYYNKEDYQKAQDFFVQALIIMQKLSKYHPDTAFVLEHLSMICLQKHDFIGSITALKMAIEVRRKTFGMYHPTLIPNLRNLAIFYAITDKQTDALALLEEMNIIDDKMIRMVFSLSSENQRMSYMQSILIDLNIFISLVVLYFSYDRKIVSKTLNVVLKRKGLSAESMRLARDAILEDRHPALKDKLKELNSLRMEIGRKILTGPRNQDLDEYQKMLTKLNGEKDILETELGRDILEIKMQKSQEEAEHANLVNMLPKDASLIEFIQFRMSDFKNLTKSELPYYVAFVLNSSDPESVSMINLGESEHIDKMIASYRKAIEPLYNISDSEQASLDKKRTEFGVSLRKAIFDPLTKAIGNSKRIFLAPDGDLTKIPFEVLPIDNRKYLLDEYHFSYLSTARDLLHLQLPTNEKATEPLVLADPDFDLDMKTSKTRKTEMRRGRQSRDFILGNLKFGRLDGTLVEGVLISNILNVKPWLQKDVLEANLKSCRSPQILHIATHGFFLHDEESKMGIQEIISVAQPDTIISKYVKENPLLRSGMALAGANKCNKSSLLPPEAEDGILTAVDVTGLDLSATELVVLSACETGLGEVHVGEGVFGLRRAFVLAGAKTLVMSLWKVPDKETQELMVEFYRQMLDNQPISTALRNAILMIREKNPNPYYWGAFICQGATDPIQFN